MLEAPKAAAHLVTGAWLCAAALHHLLCDWTLGFSLWLLQALFTSMAKGLLQLPYLDSVSLTIVVPTLKKTHKNETKHLGSSHSLDRLLPFFLPAEGNLRAEEFSFPLSTAFSCQLCWFFFLSTWSQTNWKNSLCKRSLEDHQTWCEFSGEGIQSPNVWLISQ